MSNKCTFSTEAVNNAFSSYDLSRKRLIIVLKADMTEQERQLERLRKELRELYLKQNDSRLYSRGKKLSYQALQKSIPQVLGSKV